MNSKLGKDGDTIAESISNDKRALYQFSRAEISVFLDTGQGQ